MTEKGKSRATRLRQEAEKRVPPSSFALETGTPEELQRLIHELQIHQVELDMQNDELRRTQEQLRMALDRYADLYELAPVGYLTLDARETIVQANSTASDLLKVNIEQLVGQSFSHFVFRDDQDVLYLFLRRLLRTGKSQQEDVRLALPDNAFFCGHLEGMTIHGEQDESAEIRLVITDVTRLREAQAQQFQLMIERERSALVTDFITKSSHQFRTPLSVITTTAYLMHKMVDSSQSRENLSKIETEVAHISALVDALTLMTRLESHADFYMVNTDLNNILQSLVNTLQPRLQEKNQKTFVRFKQGTLMVRGDANYLQEAMERILDNAVRYTPNEGTITIGSYTVRDRAVVEVTDTGPGIKESELPHIFERFYRGDSAGTTRGFGLGLTIAKAIIEQHQGRIEVISEPGQGSSFRLWLPAES